MNQSTKLIQKLKQRDCKVGRAITKWGVIEKLPFLKGNKNYFAF
jgi:hypothetical protein